MTNSMPTASPATASPPDVPALLAGCWQVLAELGPQALDAAGQARHTLLRVDLTDADATAAAMRQADPDLVLHLAAESHVDRSIEGPVSGAAFIDSNAFWHHGDGQVKPAQLEPHSQGGRLNCAGGGRRNGLGLAVCVSTRREITT